METNNDQYDVLEKMTPEQRLQAFFALCRSARQIKEAALRQFHPSWTEAQLKLAVRESFLHDESGPA